MSLLVPEVRALYASFRAVAAENVAALRAAHARHPHDPSFAALIALLERRSATFRRLWRRHDVSARSRGQWVLRHRSGVELELAYDALAAPEDPDQRLVLFTAADPASQARLDAILAPLDDE